MAAPYEIARKLAGTREGQAALNDYLHTGGQNLDPVTTAWCAAFVNASLAQAGMKGTGSNLARSFLKYGTPVETPQRGDIAVLSRGNPSGPYGHVGFYEGTGPGGQINVLGGNQANQVSVASYDPSRLLGYRRPTQQMTPLAEPQASQSGVQPGFAPPAALPFNPLPVAQQPSFAERMWGGNQDWLQNRSYSADALLGDFFAGRNPLRRLAYQSIMGLFG